MLSMTRRLARGGAVTETKPDGSRSVVQALRAEKVSQLMTAPALAVGESSTVLEALNEMRSAQVGCTLVTDGDDRIRGIFTERDHLEKIAGRSDRLREPITSHMTPAPAVVGPEASVGELLSVMSAGGFRHIPVVSDDRIVGIVSALDIVKYIADLFPSEVYNLPPDFDQVMPRVEGA